MNSPFSSASNATFEKSSASFVSYVFWFSFQFYLMDSSASSNSIVNVSQVLDIPSGIPKNLKLHLVKDNTYEACYNNGIVYAILMIKERKLNGLCEFYENNVIYERAMYVNNKKHGLDCHYQNGSRKGVSIFEDGQQKEILSVDHNDPSTFNSMNGEEIQFSIHFKEANSLNAIRSNYEDKQLSSIAVYEEGEMKFVKYKFRYNQMREYNEQNQLVYIGGYSISELIVYRNGKGKEYDESDRIVYDGEWKNNRWHGEGTFYNKEGEQFKGDWDNGHLIGGVIEQPSNIIEDSAFDNNNDDCNIELRDDVNAYHQLVPDDGHPHNYLDHLIFVNDHIGCKVSIRHVLWSLLVVA